MKFLVCSLLATARVSLSKELYVRTEEIILKLFYRRGIL